MPDASYPNFAGKHAGEALFTAADFVAYLRRVGVRGDEPAPAGVILCYQPSLFDHVLRAEGLDGKTPRGLPVALPSTGGRVVWSPRFRDPAVQGGLVRVYQAAVAVLAAGLDGLDGLDGLVGPSASGSDWLVLKSDGPGIAGGRVCWIRRRVFCSRVELYLRPDPTSSMVRSS